MIKQEYDEIMEDLKTVFKDVQYNQDLRPLEKWAFQKGVMECKKTLENYNPDCKTGKGMIKHDIGSCYGCDCCDEDMGCMMSSLEKGYACPLNDEQEVEND